MSSTTDEVIAPTLAELVERYAATRAAARRITRSLMMTTLELDNDKLIEDCRQIDAAHNELRTEFRTTLTSLEVALDVSLKRTLEGETGGVIAEAITGSDELYDVLHELQNRAQELIAALDGRMDRGERGPDRPTLDWLLKGAPVDEEADG